jgi:hypothetical protein
LASALADAAAAVRACSECGSWDTVDPCSVCRDPERDRSLLAVVDDVGALWALERGGAFRGRYHVLGGLLSALDGVGPDQLRIGPLVDRAAGGEVREVILALPATVDGQTTAHYVRTGWRPPASASPRWRAVCRSAATSTGWTTAPSPPRSARAAPPDAAGDTDRTGAVMAGLKDKRGFIDRDRLDLSERKAVEYWMKRWGVTSDQLTAAHRKVGRLTKDIARELGKKP